MLKFDTGLINPIEREKTSHGVLFQFVVISFSSLYMIYCYDVICFVIVRFRPYLPHFLHRILDRNHVYPADIRALDRLRTLVSVSYMAPCNFQKLYARFSGPRRQMIQVRPYTGATLCHRYIYAVILPDVPGQQMGRL